MNTKGEQLSSQAGGEGGCRQMPVVMLVIVFQHMGLQHCRMVSTSSGATLLHQSSNLKQIYQHRETQRAHHN